MSHTHAKNGVTIEDGEESEFDLSDDDTTSSSSLSSHHINSSSQSTKSSSSIAPSDPTRGGLSPGVESSFEVWLRHNVNEPILKILPEWITPNSISYTNTFVCWTCFVFSYIAYKIEHLYPNLACILRLIMAFGLFAGISLDCLDGMQARKTGRCSKLGELLDHSLDAANVPLICCCILQTMMPDVWTIIISIIGGSMIYNAQLVIYRHNHVFILPPVTGPAAQAMASGIGIFLALLYLYFSRHIYLIELGILIFCSCGNIAQFKNCAFYANHLKSYHCTMPHVRFALTMLAHGMMLVVGYLTPSEYLLSSVILAYRLNGSYVLDTLLHFKPFNAHHTREDIRREDVHWRWDCIGAIAILYLIALTCGIGGEAASLKHTTSFTGLPFITDSFFHIVLYIFMALAIALNVRDIVKAAPSLAKK